MILNGEKLLHHIGMFSKVEKDITDLLEGDDTLEVSCKGAVGKWLGSFCNLP